MQLLHNSQHCFRPGRSTFSNLLHVSCELVKSFETNDPYDVIYFDMQKDFDRVNHQKLIEMLKRLDIKNILVWINLFERLLWFAGICNITHSFLLYINDLFDLLCRVCAWHMLTQGRSQPFGTGGNTVAIEILQ